MKQKTLYLVLLFIIGLNIINAQEFKLPKNCTVFKTVLGDLDKDGIDEKVLVCNINQTSNPKDNWDRKFFILKQKDDKWILWKENSTILNSSKECGFCFSAEDDPLKKVEIKNNTLLVEQEFYNNSRRTESHKLIFRFQNKDWFLIGSRYRHWDNCDFNNLYDINFSTNQIIITKETGSCDDEPGKDSKSVKTYNYNFPKVTMDTYKPTEIKYNSKEYFYF